MELERWKVRQLDQVLILVAMNPFGSTAEVKEAARARGLTFDVARRLDELHEAGRIRRHGPAKGSDLNVSWSTFDAADQVRVKAGQAPLGVEPSALRATALDVEAPRPVPVIRLPPSPPTRTGLCRGCGRTFESPRKPGRVPSRRADCQG